MNREVEEALDEHGQAMERILEEADQLRLSTVRELVNILTALQAVDFLVASKKLHLCMHKWGKNRDHLQLRLLYNHTLAELQLQKKMDGRREG
ncbi:hypothetical protein CerSpe_171500 [Prunus speciosa]